MASKETGEKKSFFQTWLKVRRLKKKRQKFFSEEIGPSKYSIFLREVDSAVLNILKDYPDNVSLLDKLGEESSRWLNDMPKINLSSFKAGVVYGMYALLKSKRETTAKESYVV